MNPDLLAMNGRSCKHSGAVQHGQLVQLTPVPESEGGNLLQGISFTTFAVHLVIRLYSDEYKAPINECFGPMP
jgi:hypothetical protein